MEAIVAVRFMELRVAVRERFARFEGTVGFCASVNISGLAEGMKQLVR